MLNRTIDYQTNLFGAHLQFSIEPKSCASVLNTVRGKKLQDIIQNVSKVFACLRLIKWTVKSGLIPFVTHCEFIIKFKNKISLVLEFQKDERIYFTKQYILRNLFGWELQWPLNAFQIDQSELFSDIIHNQIFY